MRGFCGIDIDSDKTFLAFAALKKQSLTFYEEAEIKTYFDGNSFIDFLKKNSEVFDKKIKEKEASYPLTVEKIFLNIPWESAHRRIVEEIVPLKKMKRIRRQDLNLIKKYLEDTALDWDDYCLHHFILSYEVEGKTYYDFPLDVWAKKIKLRSLIISIKDKIRKETEDIFDNLDREFGGFVFSGVGSLCTSYAEAGVEKNKPW